MGRLSLTRRQLLLATGAAGPALWLGCESGSTRRPAVSTSERSVSALVPASPTVEGAGVHLRRSLGSRALPLLDPFLMLDEFHSDRPEDYVAGFPRHPHRGFETVTYMLHGAMEHRDSLGNQGRLGPGSIQWMTAGRGIIHSEMPKQERGLMWGFQLWVNLAARDKWNRPRYQDIAPGSVPEVSVGGSRVRVVAGRAGGVVGPISGIATQPLMLDVQLGSGARFDHALEPGHSAFAYVFDGSLELGKNRKRVSKGEIAVLSSGASVTARAGNGRMLLLAAEPLREPVARRGPFVMNTEAQLDQAFEDYRSGRLVSG